MNKLAVGYWMLKQLDKSVSTIGNYELIISQVGGVFHFMELR